MMTIKLPHRISAILMATLMLLSATGFSMDVHFCQDNIAGVSFIGKTESCCNLQSNNNKTNSKSKCAAKATSIDNKENCCHNEHFAIDKASIDAVAIQLPVSQEANFAMLVTPLGVWHSSYSSEKQILAYRLDHPPIPDRDFQVLYQAFLI